MRSGRNEHPDKATWNLIHGEERVAVEEFFPVARTQAGEIKLVNESLVELSRVIFAERQFSARVTDFTSGFCCSISGPP